MKLSFNLKRCSPISYVFNGDFEGDNDLTSEMKFKNLLIADQEYS